MKTKFLTVVLSLFVGLSVLTGCTPNYQPAYQQVQNVQPQQVISGTCVNNQQQVMDDNYCDPNWIAQQRIQHANDMAYLSGLLAYHMLYTPNPYSVGAYIPMSGVVIYHTPPMGYAVQRRSVYVTNINNHSINYSNGRASTVTTTRTVTNTSRPTNSGSFTTRSTISSSGSRPSPSYSAPRSSYSSPSSFSSSRSSSSFSSSRSSSSRR